MENNDPLLNRVYAAIADPTRRGILAALSEGESNVGGLAERFPMSFNGVSKHVKVLERAGLIERTIRGREHRLRLCPAPLREAANWFQHYRAFWEARLDALEDLLVAQRRTRGAGRAKRQRGGVR
jgi:DNA-binding transcriptional ArsR family regulator